LQPLSVVSFAFDYAQGSSTASSSSSASAFSSAPLALASDAPTATCPRRLVSTLWLRTTKSSASLHYTLPLPGRRPIPCTAVLLAHTKDQEACSPWSGQRTPDHQGDFALTLSKSKRYLALTVAAFGSGLLLGRKYSTEQSHQPSARVADARGGGCGYLSADRRVALRTTR
jgi:hypothetical protein